MSTCRSCQQSFLVTPVDQAFYQKMNVLEPTLCPDCRQQRRLAFRNERNLYARTCDLTGKKIISIYSADKKLKVYDQDAWWSDQWDPLTYGRDFDFNRSFFEQMQELLMAVPHPAAGYRFHNENCEYTTYQNHSRNCYLTFGSGYMEDCAYTNWTYYAKNSLDILGSEHLELCYELVDCNKMYSSTNCQDCSSLTDCHYCYDTHSSQNCFGCVGLRRKQFYFLNQQLSEVEYKEKIKNLDLASFLRDFEALKLKVPHRTTFQLNCENSTGDHLVNCKNVNDSFFISQAQDCTYNSDVVVVKDSWDCARIGETELSFQCLGGGFYYQCKCCIAGEQLSDSEYCLFCFNTKNLLGCVGVKRKEFCILNKQYSKEEYGNLRTRIIDHMKKTGEYGEFFPMKISPFSYNESLAQDHYLLTKEQILQRGLQWREKDQREYLPQSYQVPVRLEDVRDDIVGQILACSECGKNYKITAQELKFYRQIHLAIPRKCFDCRHKTRMALRNPRQLWDRKCSKCGATIKTTFAPERPEVVYCEKCYLETVY